MPRFGLLLVLLPLAVPAQSRPLTRAEQRAFFKAACRYWALRWQGRPREVWEPLAAQLAPYEERSWKGLRAVFTGPFQGRRRFKKRKSHVALRHPPPELAGCVYTVQVPGGYSRRKRYPLVVCLHGGSRGVGDPEQILALLGNEYLRRKCIVAAPKVPRGAVFAEEVSRRLVQEMIWEVGVDYSIDWDRIYCTGHSLGGVGAWYMAVLLGDLFAASSPAAGNPPLILDYEALLNIPLYVVHGATDIQVKPDADREAAAKVKALPPDRRRPGYFVYREIVTKDRRGHALPAPVIRDMADFLLSFRREFVPRRVIVVCPTLGREGTETKVLRWGRSHWLQLESQAYKAKAEGVLAGQTIRITLTGTGVLTVFLSDEMLDLDRPVTITVNGRTAFHGRVRRSAAFLLDHVWATRDRGRVYAARVVLREPR